MAYQVKAQTRTATGKGPMRRMRRAGNVPAVLYGHGDPSVMLELSAHNFGRLLEEIRGHSPIVDVEVDGRPPEKCVIKTLQRNPIDGSLLHIDFQKVHADERITMNVPVILLGSADGVKQGGMMEFVMRSVAIRATIDMIPERFEIDVTPLNIGSSVHIADLGRSDLEFVMPADSPIVSVLSPRKVVETAAAPEAAAGPAEPEVLKEKKTAEEEGEADKGKGDKKDTRKEGKKEEKK